MCVYAPRCKVWIFFLWRDVISVRVSIVTKFRSGVYFYKGVWPSAIFWASGNAPIAVCICVRSASIYRVHTYLLGSISQMLYSHVCDDWSICVMPYPYVWFLGTWRRFWLCVWCIDSSKLTHVVITGGNRKWRGGRRGTNLLTCRPVSSVFGKEHISCALHRVCRNKFGITCHAYTYKMWN